MVIVDTLVAHRAGPFLLVEVKARAAKSILALNGTGPLGLRSDWAGKSAVLLPQKWQETQTTSSVEWTIEHQECYASLYLRELLSSSLDKFDNLQEVLEVRRVERIKP